MARGDSSSRSGGRRTLAQRVLLGVNVLLVVACLGTAAALAMVQSTLESVPGVDIGSSQAPKASVTEARNFLIIGTDSASRLDESDPVTNGRAKLGRLADVIMVSTKVCNPAISFFCLMFSILCCRHKSL